MSFSFPEMQRVTDSTEITHFISPVCWVMLPPTGSPIIFCPTLKKKKIVDHRDKIIQWHNLAEEITQSGEIK